MRRTARESHTVHALAALAMASCGPPGAREPVRTPAHLSLAPVMAVQVAPATVVQIAPPPAGPASEQAIAARRLFDAQRWSEAASALHDVASGKTPDTTPSVQFAEYELAIALYRMGLLQSSYGIFSSIADKPGHTERNETPLWLAMLATELPEPADVLERVGKFTDVQLGRFDTPDQRVAYWHLCYLHGQYDFRNRLYEDAIRWYAKVDPRSRYYTQALFLSGMSSVQLRKSVPAVQFFEKVVAALDGGAEAEDAGRMRDLANLSLARTYYSAAITLDAPTRTIKSKPQMLSAAVKYWNRVDPAGELWRDSVFEASWGYFMAGNFAHALANIHIAEAPFGSATAYPEAALLKAQIYLTHCHYEEASAIVARLQQTYEPVANDLGSILARFKGDDGGTGLYDFLVAVRNVKAALPATVTAIVRDALSDRRLLHYIEYVKTLDRESARLKAAPQAFRDSPVGQDASDASVLARNIAVRNGGQLAKERLQRSLDELAEHLKTAAALQAGIAAAKAQAVAAGPPVTGAVGDLDAQTITSRCLR